MEAHGNDYKTVYDVVNQLINDQIRDTKFKDSKLNLKRVQMFVELIVLIKEQIKTHGGRIEDIGFMPDLNDIGFTARIGMMDLYSEKLEKFCELGSQLGCIGINGDRGDVLFSCNMRGVLEE